MIGQPSPAATRSDRFSPLAIGCPVPFRGASKSPTSWGSAPKIVPSGRQERSRWGLPPSTGGVSWALLAYWGSNALGILWRTGGGTR
jgi:hypothetical protein